MKSVAMEEGKTKIILFRKTIVFSAVAGLALVTGIGAAVVSHLALVKTINIGLSVAYIGLLVFITLTGIALINLNAMGDTCTKKTELESYNDSWAPEQST